LIVSEARPNDQAIKKINFLDSFECSPPRKSLVKGERFFRFEREPELSFAPRSGPYIPLAQQRRRAVVAVRIAPFCRWRTQVHRVGVRPDRDRRKVLASSRRPNAKIRGRGTFKTLGGRVESASANDRADQRHLSAVRRFRPRTATATIMYRPDENVIISISRFGSPPSTVSRSGS